MNLFRIKELETLNDEYNNLLMKQLHEEKTHLNTYCQNIIETFCEYFKSNDFKITRERTMTIASYKRIRIILTEIDPNEDSMKPVYSFMLNVHLNDSDFPNEKHWLRIVKKDNSSDTSSAMIDSSSLNSQIEQREKDLKLLKDYIKNFKPQDVSDKLLLELDADKSNSGKTFNDIMDVLDSLFMK